MTHGLTLLCGMWDLPGLRVEPMSAALAGGFFTTESAGKPCFVSDRTKDWFVYVLFKLV